ncbi:hypothetical protein GLAREA_07777 [Glarea lozoyensis ATCC 20868]|uniref:Uncharacterized protein n=1 Tax=Glarea lozoyensis (strain ATCC 20868 / MF5171) TaxID=1116229 RepID=S3E2F1_GLAL2|nr:uncharacterized protein GLAREA_07777 [Glarea lozoyensis ATCC 20868]EPE32643.1 hypothetical protein GLAREA_07777 [Glarea lozoyensis ATCC 20868]
MAAKKPPSTTRFEDRVESYNLANDDLRVWLENRFLAEGYKFDGDKERDEISTLREVEKDWVLEPEY